MLALTDQEFPRRLYTAEQTRQLDHAAIHQFGIPGITLMKRAGQAALQCLLAKWPAPEQLTVFCGGGNNGGDGYIVAALAAQQHIPVSLFYLSDPATLQGDAALARDFAEQAGVELLAFNKETDIKGIVVDAMLGTGTRGAPRGSYIDAIVLINASENPVLAIDVPSGLNADTGMADLAVEASATMTFIGVKQGLLTGRGPAHCGELYFDDLGVPADVYKPISSTTHRIQYAPLPPRPVDAHKGNSGHILVVGGDHGMGGAVTMAAEAAARCGAGLVSVATRVEHVNAILGRRPEVMAKGIENADDLYGLIAKATVIVIGPGLGQSDWSKIMLAKALSSSVPKVVDADALNLLSSELNMQSHRDDHWILTPHPGEAARLLSAEIEAVQRDRFQAATAIQQLRGGVVVLKGAGSLVASESDIGICTAGNPGMASGGMGDVLSGVIGALLAQGLALKLAAEVGVQIHAMAADRAAKGGQRGLLATDLMPHLRALVNGL